MNYFRVNGSSINPSCVNNHTKLLSVDLAHARVGVVGGGGGGGGGGNGGCVWGGMHMPPPPWPPGLMRRAGMNSFLSVTGKLSVMIGTLLSVLGSCQRHLLHVNVICFMSTSFASCQRHFTQKKRERYIPLKPISKGDSLRR